MYQGCSKTQINKILGSSQLNFALAQLRAKLTWLGQVLPESTIFWVLTVSKMKGAKKKCWSVDNGYLVKIEYNVKLTDIFEAPIQRLNKN